MKKNVHLIQTDKASRLKQEFYSMASYSLSRLPLTWRFAQHIYITNSEEIKEGDWYLDIISNTLHQAKQATGLFNTRKKIILTTDVDLIADGVQGIQDLIADGVQGIEDSFLEWFINNPTCDFIETERIEDGQYVDRFADGSVIEGIYENYKIIIPQEKIKQIDEKGNPLTFWGGLKKHKKESIEEEAELFAKSRVELDPIYANGLYYGFVQCGMSKWFEAEKIKAQIEENLSVLEMLKIHGTESSMFRVKMRIEGLEQQLKQLYDGI